ncbi:MAG TPA: AAA family ATPase [Planctomycetota bacterium]|nr:AAA family ATPase [Planctomycetota bacterium]
MADRLLLLTKLRLHNYKLHANTEVDLGERPILLVTGANGSGKTQVLEALRLCLGVHPSPSRARGMASVIGPAGDDARLLLDVCNPVLDGHRLLKPPHEELARELDHDRIRIATRVTASGSVQYRLGSAEQEWPTRQISAQQLRDLFRSVNIQAANRLAFTEEGVVDVFAGESGRRKLESLLEATGRLQYLEDLRQALIHLEDANRQTEPLRQKLKWERDLVASIRERLEIIRQRSKYLEQHAALCIEHAWAIVRDAEAARDGVLARTGRAEARLERCQSSLADARDALRRAEADMADHTRRATEARAAIVREKGTLERIVGHRLHLQQSLGEAQAELARLAAEREDLARIMATERGREGAEAFHDRQRELVRVEREMGRVHREVEGLDAELRAAEGEAPEPEPEPLAPTETTRFEQEMLDGCAAFHAALVERRMQGQLVGPVVSLVRIRAGEEPWERAVRCLAGRNLFAFVARDREAYAAAKALFDQVFPGRKPAITVVRHSGEEARLRRPRLPKCVHGFAFDLLEGEAHCLAFLRRVLRGAVAEASGDANELTDFAEAHDCPVLTADCRSFYASFGGFTRPPAPIFTPLGTPVVAPPGPREGGLPSTRQLEGRQRALLRRHAELASRARQLEGEMRKLGVRPEVTARLRTVEERIEGLTVRTAQMAADDARLAGQIKTLQDAINDMARAEQPLETNLDELQARVRDAQAETVRCTTLIGEEEKVVARFREEGVAVAAQLDAAAKEAEAVGRRPPEVRLTAVVAQERAEVKGKLDAIVGQTVDEENLRRKEEELEQLDAYVAERTSHIERLQADVAERRDIWQREVRSMVEHLSRVMQALLRGGAFRDVRLEVAHVEDPEKAELAIRARTKGAQWLDYRELSGGEKVLCTEALIMSLHTLSDSPVHAIDEFTQRLDRSNAAAAFDIVRKTFEMTSRGQPRLVPQFVLLCPEAFGLEENELIRHIVLVEAKLRGERSRRPTS